MADPIQVGPFSVEWFPAGDESHIVVYRNDEDERTIATVTMLPGPMHTRERCIEHMFRDYSVKHCPALVEYRAELIAAYDQLVR